MALPVSAALALGGVVSVPLAVTMGQGTAGATVAGCQVSHNYVNPNGPSVANNSGGLILDNCGGNYKFYAGEASPNTTAVGWWWNNAGYWVRGTAGSQPIGSGDTVLITNCKPCTFHVQEVASAAWMNSEY